MAWQLSRPTPALPYSYFWTWDHSANWVLDDPGLLTWGCDNRYLKRPDTYVEDYRRLTDLAAGLGVKGITIWGFLRDSHGGVEAAKRVAGYAASRGVAIMPGIGTTHYGGIYYEGDHRYNIGQFIRQDPDAQMRDAAGQPVPVSVCPSHPRFREWLCEGIQWLFDTFTIGGANLENGDFMVCHCPKCLEHKQSWPADEPEFYRLQAMSYVPAAECMGDRLNDSLVCWATYTGFVPNAPATYYGGGMGCTRPLLVDRADPRSFAQWTITGMVRRDPLPLTAYLDDGAPAESLDNPQWRRDLRPPGTRAVGFLHHGSQWCDRAGRYDLAISSIKEGCLRAYRAGMQGVSIHGEVSARHIPAALNYLAFSHFIHWPEDSLRAFGRKTLGQVLGSEAAGEAFCESLAHWDAGNLPEAQKQSIWAQMEDPEHRFIGGSLEALHRWRFWDWLAKMAEGRQERHTGSFF